MKEGGYYLVCMNYKVLFNLFLTPLLINCSTPAPNTPEPKAVKENQAPIFHALWVDKAANYSTASAPTTFTGPLINTWYTSGFIYYEELILRTDGSFNYSFESCTGKTYSAGKWKIEGNRVDLTSDEKYRESTQLPELAINTETETSTNVEPGSSSALNQKLTVLKDTKTNRFKGKFKVNLKFKPIVANSHRFEKLLSDSTFIFFENTHYYYENGRLFQPKDAGRKYRPAITFEKQLLQ